MASKNRLLNLIRQFMLLLIPNILGVLLLVPSMRYGIEPQDRKLILRFELAWAYATTLAGAFWIFNLVDLAATSLIIMFSLPLLGVVSARCLATCFTSNYNLTVLGSIFFIMAADACGLSKRLALTILKHSSGSLVWIFMDVYIVTTWLAICINSAAATFFMMIVIDELLESLKSEGSLVGQNSPEMKPTAALETPVAKPEVSVKEDEAIEADVEANDDKSLASVADDQGQGEKDNEEKSVSKAASKTTTGTPPAPEKEPENEGERLLNEFSGHLLYATAAAANIGGMLFAHGNPYGFDLMKRVFTEFRPCGPHNLIIKKGYFDATANKTEIVSYPAPVVVNRFTEPSWILYSFPLLIMTWSFTIGYLLFVHFGKGSFLFGKKKPLTCSTQTPDALKTAGSNFSSKHADLPPLNIREKLVLVLIPITVTLRLTRRTGFLTGWGDLDYMIKNTKYKEKDPMFIETGDSIIYILVAVFLFFFPSWTFKVFKGPPATQTKAPAISVGWKKIQTSYPYAIMLLIGAATCIGKFSALPFSETLSETLVKSIPNPHDNLVAITLIVMMIAIASSIFIPSPGTSIALVQLWYKLTVAYQKQNEALHPGPLLPILHLASLCFVIPVSSIPTALVYRYKGKKILSAWYFLKIGSPLYVCTLILTIAYGILWVLRPKAFF